VASATISLADVVAVTSTVEVALDIISTAVVVVVVATPELGTCATSN